MGWKAAKARGENPKAGGAAARLEFLGTTWHNCSLLEVFCN